MLKKTPGKSNFSKLCKMFALMIFNKVSNEWLTKLMDPKLPSELKEIAKKIAKKIGGPWFYWTLVRLFVNSN